MKHLDSCGIDTCGDGLSCDCICHTIQAIEKRLEDIYDDLLDKISNLRLDIKNLERTKVNIE